MPRLDYKTCRQCGQHEATCGAISHSRLCADCGLANQTRALFEIADGVGPYAERWLRRSIMAAHKQLLAAQAQRS